MYPIDALDLPTRARNALVRAGLTTPSDLAERSDEELLSLHGFGPGSLEQVRGRLAAWERERQPEQTEPEEPVAEEKPGRDAFPLLPGRRVLHAAWLPDSPGRLFLWGEGPALPPRPEHASHMPSHPFHIPPAELRAELRAALRDALPDLIPDTAEEAHALARLPAVCHAPQPGPQLIQEEFTDEADPLASQPSTLGLWRVEGLALPPLAALAFLNDLPRPEEMAPRVAPGADLGVWSLAAKLALELLARQQFAPTLIHQDEAFRAAWAPMLDQPEDLQRVEHLVQAMPPLCRALSSSPSLSPPMGGSKGGGSESPSPRSLLKDFLGAMIDAAVRTWAPPLLQVVTRRDSRTLRKWLTALFEKSDKPVVDGSTDKLEELYQEIARWQEQLWAGTEAAFRICLRLEPPALPESEDAAMQMPEDGWTLRFFLQARDDPSLLVPASQVWQERGSTLRYLDRRFDNPQEQLLTGLGQAARLFPPLETSLRTARPEVCDLTTEQAYTFLRESASLLEHSGFGVLVPQWWKKRSKRLGVHATISPTESSGILNMDALVHFRWRLALGEQMLDPEEFVHLTALKMPLVQVRGEWVELQPEQIEAAIRFWEKRAEEEMTLRQALQMGLAEEIETNGLPVVGVKTEGWVRDLLQQLSGSEPLAELPPPEGLVGQLRPYQVRGLSWLAFLRRWGLGACLADDMGLGKTIQAIALFLRDLQEGQADEPVLVVCPTSVLGNWAREIHRFAPSLEVLIHHGSDRAGEEAFAGQARQVHVVITTYALARRDVGMLREIEWNGIVLDEAQNIKNPGAKQTQAIRRLRAGYRVGLTGTPVENRLSELWSIMQFLNSGYLGSQSAFRANFARPIERYQDQEAAARLRKLVQPFILRRVKTDPTIIQDLPDKLETKVYCSLTPEQATLYQATVEDALRQVEESEGIQRKGQVLSMLTQLKQICNHPAHFLKDGSSLQDRSGKLSRLGEMLEEVLSVDERALIFTQYAEMGTLLQQHLQEIFGGEVLFLYGGTPAQRRDRMIARFQEEQGRGPSLFVLSLKAGGLGLNLTRANHVFHFDRWWNPAVENQATDRTYRIGQTRDVWVHKFICAGTLEERIDELIESKKALAESVIGAGEGWLTELDTDRLRELVTLSQEAVGD